MLAWGRNFVCVSQTPFLLPPGAHLDWSLVFLAVGWGHVTAFAGRWECKWCVPHLGSRKSPLCCQSSVHLEGPWESAPTLVDVEPSRWSKHRLWKTTDNGLPSSLLWPTFGRNKSEDLTFHRPLRFMTIYYDTWVSQIAQLVESLPAMLDTPVQFLDQEDLLEKG